MFQNTVDQAIGFGFFGGHEVVPVCILFNLIQRLAGVFEHQFVHAPFGAENFLGVDFQFRGCSLHASQRLMDHDPAVRQREPLAFCTCGKKHCSHAGTLTQAIRRT